MLGASCFKLGNKLATLADDKCSPPGFGNCPRNIERRSFRAAGIEIRYHLQDRGRRRKLTQFLSLFNPGLVCQTADWK